MTNILKRIGSSIDTTKKNIVNVDRDNVLDGGFRGFSRKSFDPLSPLDVKFSDEDGIDTGGPTREFLRLAMNSVKDLPIFAGPDNQKMLVLDYRCQYFIMGSILVAQKEHIATKVELKDNCKFNECLINVC